MIFNNDMIFIHIGKTGGMSCAQYLLHNLKPPVYNCHHDALIETFILKVIKRKKGIVAMPNIHRHCTLVEDLDFIFQFNGMRLEDFKKVVAVIRHPYTLEYSLYNHLQKPLVRRRRKKDARLLELAKSGFKNFAENAPYHRKNHSQDKFFCIDKKIPSNLELIKFEEIEASFPKAVSPFLKKGAAKVFPNQNSTKYQSDIHNELTDEVKDILYHKHTYMFDSGLYSTE